MASQQVRTIPRAVVGAGGSQVVTLEIVPDESVLAYAVEEIVNDAWEVEGLSGDGVIDGHKLKWGVYFDRVPRTITYTLKAPQIESSFVFEGVVSYNGVSFPIEGDMVVAVDALPPGVPV